MITKLPDDPPAIDVPPGSWPSWKAYFDANVRCGYMAAPTIDPITGRLAWHKPKGCGASDWIVEPAFWYPRPGKQFELRCAKCGAFHGVEVRTDKSGSLRRDIDDEEQRND